MKTAPAVDNRLQQAGAQEPAVHLRGSRATVLRRLGREWPALIGAVIVLTFAPVLVWADRRQSAMIQDRIGPIRAEPCQVVTRGLLATFRGLAAAKCRLGHAQQSRRRVPSAGSRVSCSPSMHR
jgi:hypothetical protein